MKRKIMLVVAVCVVSFTCYAQAPSLAWDRVEGGSGYDEGSGVAKAPDGTIYICGWFASSFMFGNIQVDPPTSGDASFIAKLRPDNTLVWVKAYGGAGYLRDIAVAADGSIYVTGTETGITNLYIAKVDSQMNTIWEYSSSAGVNPGSGSWLPTNIGNMIMIDHSGNIITCGTFTDSLSIDTAVLRAGNGSATMGYAVKLDPAGHVIWARKGKDGGDGFSVAVDQNDNAYFGYSYRDPNTSYTFSADVQKFSPSGIKLWEAKLEGVEQTCIVSDNNNSPYVAAHLRDTAIIGGVTYIPADYEETVLAKMDASTGNVVWAKDFVGGTGIGGSNFTSGIGYSTQLGVVVYAYGPISINGTSYTGQNLFSFGSNGAINWTAPGPQASVNDMILDQADIYLVGHKTITSNNNDIYLAKMSQSATGISKIDASPGIDVYPNPAADCITIDAGSGTENVQIEVFNSLGKKVEQFLVDGKANFPLTLSAGIYFMRYCLRDTILLKKLVVE